MKKKYFSAFKLFYDEFIYKSNQLVSYANVDENIDRIRNLVTSLRTRSIVSIKKYMNFLGEANKKLKKELDEMYELNKPLFDLYYLIYSSRVEYCTDKVKDMPFIISNSFFEDYRLDNKSFEELESSSYAIPKYSTLEKKEIRSEAEGLTKLNYLCYLMKKTESEKFKSFLEKANIILSIEPKFSETREDFLVRAKNSTSWFKDDFLYLSEAIVKTDYYIVISEKMEIAYRKKFYNWLDNYDSLIEEQFNSAYDLMENNHEIKRYFNRGNDISYDEYISTVEEMYGEKVKLEHIYECGGFHPVKYYQEDYFYRFRESVVNSYFDNRFLLNVDEEDDVNVYAEKTMDLYSLAEDLENEIYDYNLFLASHSQKLGRCSDAKTSIILKLYDMYNPTDLLYKYESVRSYFDHIVRNKDLEFKREYDNILFEQKKYFAFEGVIPTMKAVIIKYQNRLKQFILSNYENELVSKCDEYDTRNYDLSILLEQLEIDDIKEIYKIMKEENLFKHNVIQEFIVPALTKKIYPNSKSDITSYYDDVCKNYLKEERLFK